MEEKNTAQWNMKLLGPGQAESKKQKSILIYEKVFNGRILLKNVDFFAHNQLWGFQKWPQGVFTKKLQMD